jgi:hypothetical protein
MARAGQVADIAYLRYVSENLALGLSEWKTYVYRTA